MASNNASIHGAILDILYKYYSFEAGLQALQSNKVGFSDPTKFNDPMEGQLWLHTNEVTTSYWSKTLESTGILCMTEDPVNPLMWSHYGNNHTGFAIGYKANDPIFSDQNDTICSAENGHVFFEPDFEFSDVSVALGKAKHWLQDGLPNTDCTELKQAIRHLFLLKQCCWKYEKEVRIVKLLSCPTYFTDKWIQHTGNNAEPLSQPLEPGVSLANSSRISLLPVSKNTICDVVLGMRNPLISGNARIEASQELHDVVDSIEGPISVAKWDQAGKIRKRDLQNEVTWGWPQVTSAVRLKPQQVKAIADKISTGSQLDEGMTVASYHSGSVVATWDRELRERGRY